MARRARRVRYGSPREEASMSDLLVRVEEAGRAAAAHAAEGESLRRLSDEVAAAIVASGLPRAWVPSRYGGGSAGALDVLDAIEALAFHDGAAGWCGMIYATTSLTAAYLPPDHAEALYGDPGALTAGFAMPSAVATRVPGGLRVTGRWSWGSGVHHCSWIGGGVTVEGGGSPFVFFEPGQVDLLDTWHVAGLRGTGSTDYAVTDAVVPEGRWVHVGRAPALVDDPVHRLPFFGTLALGIAMVALGLARRAHAELVELAAAKQPALSSRTLAQRPAVQLEVARAEAAWRSARALVREVVEEATVGDEVTGETRRRLRLAATHATWSAAGAVDRMYHAGGGSSVHESSPLQRVFRDVHVATQHAMVAERTLEPLGRMALGLPTDVRLL
jgi:alkylation response protein AidB-like acyl-CoA dehydrogenase